MSHVTHIAAHRASLDQRWQILRKVREFFWSQDFTEVETPLLLRLPGQEPYLSPMPARIHDETGKEFLGYLHTSPEYTLKKMLAAGYQNIFSISKCFRDHESFGGTHNPEFTMVEWYRAGNFYELMTDVEELLKFLGLQIPVRRMHMRELWQESVQVDLNDYLETDKMRELCIAKGYQPAESESYEDVFFRIFLNEIEPKMKDMGVVMLHHYPAQMAALSKIPREDSRYAERVEVYINGLELANGFTELTDATEQRRRLEEERLVRQNLGKAVYDVDAAFIDAVGQMPDCTGIALGVDRLVQVLTGCENIDDVLVLPAKQLFP